MRVEGATRIPFEAATPSAPGPGPGTTTSERPFYNPAMARNRDLTVRTVAAEAQRRGRSIDVADALCGAGARTLRIAREVSAPLTVHANDVRPDALQALLAGARENDVAQRIEARRGDAHAFLASRRFDVVDIDPYGSPAPFVDAAVRATRHDGLLLLTATDTAALCGVYPRVARRRYGLRHDLHKWAWRAEVGLRGLLALAARAAGRHERGMTPLWSVSSGHWMRIAIRIHDGARAADATARLLSWAVPDERGMAIFQREPPGPETATAGPLWAAPLHDPVFLDAMQDAAGASDADASSGTLLATLVAEADAPPFWLDLDAFCGGRAAPTCSTRAAQERLQQDGYAAAPTHMSPKGVRTDAPLEALVRLLTP